MTTTKRKGPVSAKESWTGKTALDFKEKAIEAHQERLNELLGRQKWCDKNKEEYPQYLKPRISQLEESIAFLKELRSDRKSDLPKNTETNEK